MTEKFGSNLNTYIIAYRSEAKTVNMYDYVKTHIRWISFLSVMWINEFCQKKNFFWNMHSGIYIPPSVVCKKFNNKSKEPQ